MRQHEKITVLLLGHAFTYTTGAVHVRLPERP